MALIDDAYKSIADLNLWFKTQSNDSLTLGDVPELIPLRWGYFRDNWEFIKPQLVTKVNFYQFPSILTQQIEDFSKFIESQRSSRSKANPFSDAQIPKRFFAVFDCSEIQAVAISQIEQGIIDKSAGKVKRFAKNDFLAIREQIVAARDQMADSIGGQDADYNRVYNRSSIPALVDPTITAISEIQVMMDAIKAVDFIIANSYSLKSVAVDPFALAKANANNPDFNMSSYASGNLVRLNYGDDLKALARKYLGDPDKWIDIAVANGLKPPYIDETGVQLALISNGSTNQINIAATDPSGNANIDKLFINQIVFLQSDTEKFPDQRIIINIQVVPVSGEIVLQLSGENDLSRYTKVDNAYIRVFKPNTTNSGFYILIPSTDSLPNDTKGDVPWFLSTKGEDERRAKVDLLLDEGGDLVFGSTGDVNLNYGISNAFQALQLKFGVESGSLAKHPEYGLVNVGGLKNVNPGQIKGALTTSIQQQIANDPRFERLESLNIQSIIEAGGKTAGYVVKLVVRLAGSGSNIPISFRINPN